jgi:N utilization substance protein A
MAKSEFTLAFNEITEAHQLPQHVVIDALRQALISAFRRDSDRVSSAQRVEAEVDPATNRYRILLEKEVVEDSTQAVNPLTEIRLSEARAVNPKVEVGDIIMAPHEINTKTFGRIAAQTAKQVILQKIREAERAALYHEFKNREGELVIAQVQSVNNQQVTVLLNGRAEAILPAKEQISGERLKQNDKIRVYILEVKESTRGPQIIVSRAHRNMLRRLLEFEVQEIYQGLVEIKSVAREAGQRAKVAVAALQSGIDPVGACVGPRGARIQAIVKELHNESIDVVEWKADPKAFIAESLKPARVESQYIYLEDDLDQGNTATVIVLEEKELSLAIGAKGQNARLAAKLTGWRIDIKSLSEVAFEILPLLSQPPLARLAAENPDLVAEATRILEKKRAERTVMPEEYQTLKRFVHMAQLRLLEQRQAEQARRRKLIEQARQSLPRRLFQMQLKELELAEDILKAIQTRSIQNVGDLMARLQVDEQGVLQLLEMARVKDSAAIALSAIKDAIESLVPSFLSAPEPQPADKLPVSTSEQSVLSAPSTEPTDEEAPPAFVDVEAPNARRLAPAPLPPPAKPRRPAPISELPPAPKEEPRRDRRGGKGKQKPPAARDLIYDEERGETVRLRKHKRRSNRDWEDYED